MNNISSRILSSSAEAALLVRCGKIAFANSAAQEILGPDCQGMSFSSLFPAEICGSQAPDFLSEMTVQGRHCIVRAARLEDELLIFLSPAELPDQVLNEPFICSMRSSLMSTELSAGIIRDRAEELKDPALLSSAASLTRSYCRMMRLTFNAAFVLSREDCLSPSALRFLNLSSYFRSIMESTALLCPEMEFVWELGEDLSLRGEPGLLRSMLLNLISNCLVHAEGCTRISVSLQESGDSLVLSVSDNGQGMDARALRCVFRRYLSPFTLSEMGGGAGLGLTVVRRAAQLHGGTLILESRQGFGTSIRVSLSRRQSDAELCSPLSTSAASARELLIDLSDGLSPSCYIGHFLD